jgi:hypothetical protein
MERRDMNPSLPRDDSARNALAALRQFARPRLVRDHCELCNAALADEHAHLVEVSSRRLVCACEACAILFSNQGAGKYRRVPREVSFLVDFQLTDTLWDGLQLPIDLAFFLHSTPAGRVVAVYPSPGGATEALVPMDAWEMLVEDIPVLRTLEPDVEALLVNRLRESSECYRVGIDECYKLVGVIRTHWRGFSGGTAVWEEIERFFAALKQRSGHGGGTAHA